MLFFNRGGEPVLFDPIADRKSNAHMLILGPTGSGKSALLVYDLPTMATHRISSRVSGSVHDHALMKDIFDPDSTWFKGKLCGSTSGFKEPTRNMAKRPKWRCPIKGRENRRTIPIRS
jgi:hypothetical protein